MSLAEIINAVDFLIDAEGNKKAAVLDWKAWEELLALLEDFDDAAELTRLKQSGAEVVTWEQAKAELRAGGVNV
jgi:hypothetical protein